MVAKLQRLCLTLIVITSCTHIPEASGKPTIAVEIKLDAADRNLRHRFVYELIEQQLPKTIEQYLVDQFIQAFSSLQMFDFTTSTAAVNPTATLTLEISSYSYGRTWPASDVRVTMQLSSRNAPETTFVLFQRAKCGESECAPRTFLDSYFYQRKFLSVIQQWPRGMFRSITLSDRAAYQPGGIIRTIESLSEFESESAIPSALYEITFGTTQRQFAFCLDAPSASWNALGRDQGDSVVSVPNCYIAPNRTVAGGADARVTLLRAFL